VERAKENFDERLAAVGRVRYRFSNMRIEAEILNELGLHARPAAEFVRAVHKFKCTVTIESKGVIYSGASILEVLSANLDCGSRIAIEAVGPDAESALAKLQRLLHDFRDQENAERKK
jgi:phosphocarrier protein